MERIRLPMSEAWRLAMLNPTPQNFLELACYDLMRQHIWFAIALQLEAEATPSERRGVE